MSEIPKLTISKSKFIERIQKRIEKGQEIDRNIQSNHIAVVKHYNDVKNWDKINNDILETSFNIIPNRYIDAYKYETTNDELFGMPDYIASPDVNDAWFNFQNYISIKIGKLGYLIEKVEYMMEVETTPINNSNQSRVDISNNKVFIVHGHDDVIKLQVDRVLTKLGLEPIILNEQANKGRTIIENFEVHSDVGFAVVLLTADDLGKAKNDKILQKRARQNVILELGYFMGRHGRNKVMTLISDGVEKPSDILGLLYCKIDDAGGWKMELAKELKASGFNIDFNKLY